MQKKIQSAPTIVYPESDGKPMAETDTHQLKLNVFGQREMSRNTVEV